MIKCNPWRISYNKEKSYSYYDLTIFFNHKFMSLINGKNSSTINKRCWSIN